MPFNSAFLFLSTLSLRRATNPQFAADQIQIISIHALLAESDQPILRAFMPVKNFYPRSPCGERRGECGPDGWCLIISIHALLAESDAYTGTAMPAPRRFLSTLSLRRATRQACRATPRPHHFYPRSPCGERRTSPGRPGGSPRYFYPRSPCGERHTVVKENTTAITISIHALLAESDQMTCWLWTPARTFLSTLSLRRATVMPLCMRQGGNDFYPRSPCGERLIANKPPDSGLLISIHALLAESDLHSQSGDLSPQ